jgi:hypothetical protein
MRQHWVERGERGVVGGYCGGGVGGREGRGRRTESVHLNWPRNIRVSAVVMRRVLFRREVR